MNKKIISYILAAVLLFACLGGSVICHDALSAKLNDINETPADKLTDEGILTGEEYEQYGSVDNTESYLNFKTDREQKASFNYADVPAYSGDPYAVVNNNVPFFSSSEYTTSAFETYSRLDRYGRCGVAYANICPDIIPYEDRKDIGSVTPTGWHSVSYDCVPGSLYNRCHLIAFALAGENANEKNLITGTRYMNMKGMLPFENQVWDYIAYTGNHVLYRVTPVFEGDNLLASGVLMEAYSVEDSGDGIQFCVFCYNVQPGIQIDYSNGNSAACNSVAGSGLISGQAVINDNNSQGSSSDCDYVLNKNTKKFHYPDCSSVGDMSEKNKWYYNGTRQSIIDMGYSPCKICKP